MINRIILLTLGILRRTLQNKPRFFALLGAPVFQPLLTWIGQVEAWEVTSRPVGIAQRISDSFPINMRPPSDGPRIFPFCRSLPRKITSKSIALKIVAMADESPARGW